MIMEVRALAGKPVRVVEVGPRDGLQNEPKGGGRTTGIATSDPWQELSGWRS